MADNLDDITDPDESAADDADNDAEQTQDYHDIIAENTDFNGSFALYHGPRDKIGTGWSLAEQWVVDQYDLIYPETLRDHCDVHSVEGAEYDVKSCRVRSATQERGKFVIRRENHNILLNRPNNPNRPSISDTYYHAIVKQRLDEGLIYFVANETIRAEDLDTLITDYKWTGWTRSGDEGTDYEDIQLPWIMVPGFEKDDVENRAQLTNQLYRIIKNYDADTVRAVLDDIEDLVELLDKHDAFPDGSDTGPAS